MLYLDDSHVIKVPAKKYWDNQNGIFITSPETILHLEHSLTSIQIWEGIHKKAFLKKEEKTNDEMVSYIQCMTIEKDVPPIVYSSLTQENIIDINKYIADDRTASVVNSNSNDEPSHDVPTSDLILYWMSTLQVPIEARHWHLNRLLGLIKVFNAKNKPSKQSSRADTIKNHAARKAAARRRRH